MLRETAYYQSPVGWLEIVVQNQRLISLAFARQKKTTSTQQSSTLIKTIQQQLAEYFAKKRKTFDVPYELNGTPFQKKVWQALTRIPHGTTASYKDVAVTIDNPKAMRAVGQANNKNHISIIVPCHRVIGANKALVGYAGGLRKKLWLLNHEKSF